MKCSVNIDANVQKELNASTQKNCLILFIVGMVSLIAYISLSMYYENIWLNILLTSGAILFGFGLVFLITINKTNKKAASDNLSAEYEFEEEQMVITSFKNGEQFGTTKIYYKDLVKVKETKNYLFLYANKVQAFAVPKMGLTKEEFSLLKVWVYSAKRK